MAQYDFPSHGKWDGSRLEDVLKQSAISIIYHESATTGSPENKPCHIPLWHKTGNQRVTEEILEAYVERWPIELFFRQSKGKLAIDKYQMRPSQGIRRYWLIMSLVYLLCCSIDFCANLLYII